MSQPPIPPGQIDAPRPLHFRFAVSEEDLKECGAGNPTVRARIEEKLRRFVAAAAEIQKDQRE